MKHATDLSPMLSEWTFDPASVSARWVDGADGEKKIQLRLDLGIFQMEPKGRPDGQKPHGHESVLDYYRRRMLTDRRTGYRLDGDACAELQQESVQYYYRYLSQLALREYDGVIADTQHNLDIFELVERDCANPDIVWEFLQFKPYVLMMNTRGRAERLAQAGEIEPALDAIEKGQQRILAYLEDNGEELGPDGCPEIAMLNELGAEIEERGTDSGSDVGGNVAVKLQEKLSIAIRAENFEEAAKLRDQIKEIEAHPERAEEVLRA